MNFNKIKVLYTKPDAEIGSGELFFTNGVLDSGNLKWTSNFLAQSHLQIGSATLNLTSINTSNYPITNIGTISRANLSLFSTSQSPIKLKSINFGSNSINNNTVTFKNSNLKLPASEISINNSVSLAVSPLSTKINIVNSATYANIETSSLSGVIFSGFSKRELPSVPSGSGAEGFTSVTTYTGSDKFYLVSIGGVSGVISFFNKKAFSFWTENRKITSTPERLSIYSLNPLYVTVYEYDISIGEQYAI